jgi:hypothetical protein
MWIMSMPLVLCSESHQPRLLGRLLDNTSRSAKLDKEAWSRYYRGARLFLRIFVGLDSRATSS